jgi:MFS family permease
MISTPSERNVPGSLIPRRRWGIAILLGIGVLVNYFDRVNLSVAREALHSEFGLSMVAFGYMSSAFNWTYAALQLPMGVLLDRFGVKALGRIGAILWSIASFGAAVSPGTRTFFSMRLLLGIGEAPTFPAYSKATGYWFPRRERSLATAIFDAAGKFGPAIGVLFVGVLVLRFGWRFSFAATGLISFLYFVAFYIFYRDPKDDRRLTEIERRYIAAGGSQPHSDEESPKSAPLGYLLQQRKVLGLVFGFFGYNYCFYLLLYWMPTYFSALHLEPAALRALHERALARCDSNGPSGWRMAGRCFGPARLQRYGSAPDRLDRRNELWTRNRRSNVHAERYCRDALDQPCASRALCRRAGRLVCAVAHCSSKQCWETRRYPELRQSNRRN